MGCWVERGEVAVEEDCVEDACSNTLVVEVGGRCVLRVYL